MIGEIIIKAGTEASRVGLDVYSYIHVRSAVIERGKNLLMRDAMAALQLANYFVVEESECKTTKLLCKTFIFHTSHRLTTSVSVIVSHVSAT